MSRIDDLIAEYCPDGVEYKRLGDVCKIKNGKDYKHLSAGDIPVYGSGGVMDVRVDTSVYNRPTVLLPRKGSIANVFYVDGPFWNVDTIFYTVIDEEQVIPRYLYHVMMNAHIENYSTGSAARPSLTQSALNKIEIPVPPPHCQCRRRLFGFWIRLARWRRSWRRGGNSMPITAMNSSHSIERESHNRLYSGYLHPNLFRRNTIIKAP